jgi:hypothetical protein
MVQLMHGWKAPLVVFLVAAGITHNGYAGQKPKEKAKAVESGDVTIEAKGYLDQSDRELECSPETAKSWAEKATRTVDGATLRDQKTRDIVGDIKSDSLTKRAAAESRISHLSQVANQARSVAKRTRVESAQGLLREADAKECYAGFRYLRNKIAQQQERALDSIRMGDALLDTQPKKALSYYRKAQKIDSEYPGLDQKIQWVSRSRRNRNSRRTYEN